MAGAKQNWSLVESLFLLNQSFSYIQKVAITAKFLTATSSRVGTASARVLYQVRHDTCGSSI